MATVQSLMKQTLALASGYRRTGGIHCASLASIAQERIQALYEDVGRHNAVDKVVGHMLLRQLNAGDLLLSTSGRISSEMALKAIHSGITIISTITTCTDLAVEIANKAGLTVIVRTLKAPRVLFGPHMVS